MKQERPPFEERLIKGLNEVLAHVRGEITLRTHEVLLPDPPRSYNAEDIYAIRKRLGYSQAIFAQVLAVSVQTVRSWEQGVRKPSGSAARLISILEEPSQILKLTGVGSGAITS